MLAALSALIDCALTLPSGGPPVIASWAAANSVSFGVLAVPLGLILGLLSNTLFFYLLDERLVYRAVRAAYRDLDLAEKAFNAATATDTVNALPATHRSNALAEVVDVGTLLLPDTSLPGLAMARDGFWVYMDFQLNLALSAAFAWPAIIWATYIAREKLGLAMGQWIIASVVLSVLFVCVILMLIGAARMNYYYYRRRLLALAVTAVVRRSKNTSTGQAV